MCTLVLAQFTSNTNARDERSFFFLAMNKGGSKGAIGGIKEKGRKKKKKGDDPLLIWLLDSPPAVKKCLNFKTIHLFYSNTNLKPSTILTKGKMLIITGFIFSKGTCCTPPSNLSHLLCAWVDRHRLLGLLESWLRYRQHHSP